LPPDTGASSTAGVTGASNPPAASCQDRAPAKPRTNATIKANALCTTIDYHGAEGAASGSSSGPGFASGPISVSFPFRFGYTDRLTPRMRGAAPGVLGLNRRGRRPKFPNDFRISALGR
jgi:hypothetical protein